MNLSADATSLISKLEAHHIWKKNAPQLYDVLLCQELVWPSVTISFFRELSFASVHAVQRMILATNTSGEEEEYLIVAEMKLPEESRVGERTKMEDKGMGSGLGPASMIDGGIDIPGPDTVEKKTSAIYIATEATVNRGKYIPQNQDIIVCKTDAVDVLLFDRTKHPSGKPKEHKCAPLLRLKGHTQGGYGLDLSSLKEGYVISGGDDFKVHLYDVSGVTSGIAIIDPLRAYTGHTNVVNDVSFSCHNPNLFSSAADDCNVMLWDTRVDHGESSKPLFSLKSKREVQCVAFNPFTENLLATGQLNKEVVLWDHRKPNAPVHTLLGHGFKDPDADCQVLSLHWSPFHEKMLATSAKDERVIVWDIDKIGGEIETDEDGDIAPEVFFIHSGHMDEVSDFAWSLHDEYMIASVSADNVVQVWQIAESIYGEDDEDDTNPENLE